MDSSQHNLLSLIDEQKKTIEKYSNKLRDIVAAHKSLLVEKKALEETIKILNEAKGNDANTEKKEDVVESEEKENKCAGSTQTQENELQRQLNSLLVSFSNVVAEKSHMEECFKINQKQLIDEKEAMEKKCKELQDQVRVLVSQLKSIESKNQNESTSSKKDSKKHLKSSTKNLNQDDKSKSLENELLTLQVKNYEKELKTLSSELDARRLNYELLERKLKDCTSELTKLQEEMRNIQIEHQMAIQHEKEKAKDVEEKAKKLTAVQEERVVNLETRLAELSETIGSYDRLRLQDQTEIQKLKEHITLIDVAHKGGFVEQEKPEAVTHDDFDLIVSKILDLKKQLKIIAEKSGKEEEFRNLFPDNINSDSVHLVCKEEYNKIRTEYETFKNEVNLFNSQAKSGKETVALRNQIKNLQEKVRILSDKNKELEKEYQLQIDQLKKIIKNEKARFKETLATSESDYRGRVWLLEEQLQKQRERSLALLEEKEQEIHSLQSTFQMFLPGYERKFQDESTQDSNVLKTNQFMDGPHIVHYANELARRDIEISNLRRSKHQIEMSLRDLQKEIATVMEKEREERKLLKEEIARLERFQTREGSNLEYLKNVVFSFLMSSDPKSKRHMCNAIAAVLKFSDSELQKVIEHSKNSWWTRSNLL